MDYQGYHDWYTLDVDPAKYYAEIAAVQDPDPQATARTRDTDETIRPPLASGSSTSPPR